MGIDDLLRLAVEKQASDLHIAVGSPPVLRVQGALLPLSELPVVQPQEVHRILEAVSSDEQREAFFKKKGLDFAYSVPGVSRFRCNAYFQRGTVSLAFRKIPYQIPSLEELGLPEICKALVSRPRGLVLVTGPAGSGKSTTLAAIINHLNEHYARRVITVEDPIEFLHPNKKCLIVQREVGADCLSFADALTHVLRQDPDVILVGEMRDLETMSLAMTASETGHLVLATLHTVNAAQTVNRIVDVFPSEQQNQVRTQLSLVLEGVLSQALLPRADGKGRVAAFEVMVATIAIRNLLREDHVHQIPNYIQMGTSVGMQSMDHSLHELVRKGLVTPQDALAKAQDPKELSRLLNLA